MPLQPVMVRGWQEKFGIGVINFFGSNEGIGLLSSLEDFPDPDHRAQFFPRYGTPGVTWSGRISEWMQVRLVDVITGEDIDEPGRQRRAADRGPARSSPDTCTASCVPVPSTSRATSDR